MQIQSDIFLSNVLVSDLEDSKKESNISSCEKLTDYQIDCNDNSSPKRFFKSNIILYDEPKELPEESNNLILTYISTILAGDIITKVLFGMSLMVVRFSESMSLAPVSLVLLGFAGFKIFSNVIFYQMVGRKTSELRATYFFEAALGITFAIFFLGCLLFLSSKIDSKILLLFLAPHVLSSILRTCAGSDLLLFTAPPSHLLCESIQLFFIISILETPEEEINWVLRVIYYRVLIFSLLVISIILLVITANFAIIITFSNKKIIKSEWAVLLFLGSSGFYCSWNASSLYLTLTGFIQFHRNLGIASQFNEREFPPRLFHGSLIMFICGLISLALLLLTITKFKSDLIQFFSKNKVKGLSFIEFAFAVKEKITFISKNYFKKNSESTTEAEVNPEEFSHPSCLLCSNTLNEVLIEPCMHSGICKNCMINMLNANDLCPICKTQIEIIHILFWDTNQKKYLSSGFMKIDN